MALFMVGLLERNVCMNREDRIWESIVAVLVIGLSIGAWVVSASFQQGENGIVGPGLFPRVLGVLLIVSSVMVLFGSWRKPLTASSSKTGSSTAGSITAGSSTSNSSANSDHRFTWPKLLRVVGLLIAVAFTPLLLGQFGLLVTSVIMTVGVCFLLGAKWHEALIAGVVMLAFVYLVFMLLLKVGA
jgi:putative tricarboxylic transport membrane protein